MLTSGDVAAALGVSRSTVARWRRAGLGPTAVRVGRTVRYPKDDFDAWLEAHTAAGAENDDLAPGRVLGRQP